MHVMVVYIEDQEVNMEEAKVCPNDALFSYLLLWKTTETRSNLRKKGFLRLPPPIQNPSARILNWKFKRTQCRNFTGIRLTDSLSHRGLLASFLVGPRTTWLWTTLPTVNWPILYQSVIRIFLWICLQLNLIKAITQLILFPPVILWCKLCMCVHVETRGQPDTFCPLEAIHLVCWGSHIN